MGVSALELRRRVLMAQPHKERKTGGIVSFNTHVPQVLGVSVPLSPVQAGTGDPYPPGGGVNLVDVQDVSGIKSQTQIKAGISLPAGTYTLSAYIANNGTAGAGLRILYGSGSFITIGYSSSPTPTRYSRQFTLESATENLTLSVVGTASGYDASVSQVQIEKGSTLHDYAPYSNIRPISGHTGAAVWRTGRNLMQTPPFGVSATQVNDFGADFQFDAITFSFKANNTIAQYTNAAVVDLREENGVHHYITLSNCKNSEGQTFKANTETSGIYSKTLTNIKFRYVYAYYTGASYSKFNGDNVTEWQIEPGATASEYAPYSGESFPFTFPDTVYGGRLEPAAGRVVVDRALVDLGTLTWTSDPGRLTVKYTRSLSGSIFKKSPWADAICSEYALNKNGPDSIRSGQFSTTNAYGAGYVFFKDDAFSGMTVGEVKEYLSGVQLVYELAEPLIIPLSPAEIRALMGENNVFADTGDVDVEFWTN